MIRSLRAKHRLWWIFSAIALPLLLFFATQTDQGPVYTVSSSPELGRVLFSTQFEAQASGGIATVGVKAVQRTSKIYLELDPSEPLKKPDTLVYWQTDDRLENARLLGTLGGNTRDFPLSNSQQSGTVVLYSLGHQKVLGQVPVDLRGDR